MTLKKIKQRKTKKKAAIGKIINLTPKTILKNSIYYYKKNKKKKKINKIK